MEASEVSRWKIKGWYTQYGVETKMDLTKLVVDKHGAIHTVGMDPVGSFEIKGHLKHDGEVEFRKQYIGQHEVLYVGKLVGRTIEGRWHIGDANDTFRIKIKAKVWKGWYEQGHTKHDVEVLFKFDEEDNVGFGVGHDSIGSSIWHGTLTDGKAHLIKQYVGKHQVVYTGDYDGKTFSGRWEIVGNCSGTFWFEKFKG